STSRPRSSRATSRSTATAPSSASCSACSRPSSPSSTSSCPERRGRSLATPTRTMNIDLTNRVAIVTGAGAGLGAQHALLLARLGAKVVVNDLGSDVSGRGGSASAAQRVVDEIRALGGEAVANGASVTDYAQIQQMVAD